MPLDAVSLVQALAADGDDVEGMLVVGLDRERRVCGVAINPHHRALSFMKVWELEALLQELDACSLVVALFPPGPVRRADRARGRSLRRPARPSAPRRRCRSTTASSPAAARPGRCAN